MAHETTIEGADYTVHPLTDETLDRMTNRGCADCPNAAAEIRELRKARDAYRSHSISATSRLEKLQDHFDEQRLLALKAQRVLAGLPPLDAT